MVRRALRELYGRHFAGEAYIEPSLFEAVSAPLRRAVEESFPQEADGRPDSFRHALLHSADVFAAFKVHTAQCSMASRMLDADGNLKSFERWSDDVRPIASHQFGPWLRTEYDTAVIRAHQAADWQQFERYRDILPNLRWVPSTSPNPGQDHIPYWGTILPVDHPFWSHHRPGDRWNCKCSLEATDEPATSVPAGSRGSDPHQGLDSNPGTTAQLFSQSHPYFPDSCTSCPFGSGLKNKLRGLFTSRQKDCYNCRYIETCINKNLGRESIRGATMAEIQRVRSDGTMPIIDFAVCDAISTGVLKRTGKVRNRLLHHCYHDYDVKAAVLIWNNPQELKFIRVSPLGEGKDLSSEKDLANIKKKREILRFLEFRLYRFSHQGRSFDVKLAVHEKGYELFYSLCET